METTQPALEPLDDADFRRVLIVVAHPDDAEYGTSAAVAHWTRRGVEVGYLLLTAGEAGMQRPPEEAGPLRAVEQRNACDIVGVESLTILDFPDGMLEYGLDLRRAVAREIRRFRPDAVLSGAGEAPHAVGHRPCRPPGRRRRHHRRRPRRRQPLGVPRAPQRGSRPWGTTWLLLTGTKPTHYVALDAEDERRGVASLTAHEAYLADLPWHPAPGDFIPEMLKQQGESAGVERAVVIAAHRLRG